MSLAVAIAILAAFGFYLRAHIDDLKIESLDARYLLAAFGIYLIRPIVLGAVNRAMLRALGSRVSLWECYWLAIVANASNLLLPMSSAALRGYYLKQKHQFAYTHFLSTLLGAQFLLVLVASLTALGCLALMAPLGQGHGRVLILVLALTTLVGGIAASLLPDLGTGKNWVYNKIVTVIQGWHALRRRKSVVLQVCALGLLLRVFDAFTFWLAARGAGFDVPPLGAVALTSATATIGVLRITPGNLGIHEALVGFVSDIIGLTIPQGIAIALLCRTVAILRTVLLAPIGTWVLTRNLYDNEDHRGNEEPG